MGIAQLVAHAADESILCMRSSDAALPKLLCDFLFTVGIVPFFVFVLIFLSVFWQINLFVKAVLKEICDVFIVNPIYEIHEIHLCNKVPIGYNGTPKIHPQTSPFRFVCVCLSVGPKVYCSKTADWTQMPFGMVSGFGHFGGGWVY